MLIHGFGATPAEFRPLADALGAAGHETHALLLPGHGTSVDDFGRVRAEEWLSHVVETVDERAAAGQPLAVIGMSMGALLALSVAVERADLVRALVLCGTALEVRDRRVGWLGMLGRLPLLPHLIPPIPRRGQRDISDVAARAESPTYDRLPLHAVGQLTALQRRAQAWPPRVRQPSLILHGRDDHAVPVSVVDRLRRELGADWVEHHVLERSWHVITMDVERHEVSRLTLDFLGRVETTLP